MNHWDLESIPWDLFDAGKVDPDLLILAKTASVVEYNSADYVAYLHNVFPGDPELARDIERWGEEERRHGLALARWAKLVDPSFDFEKALVRFRDAFRVPMESTTSIRGSRSAELVARCLVECGTTSYYSSLADIAEEPVFKRICKLIAMDEVHHYGLFFKNLQKYLEIEPMSVLERFRVALARSLEAGEDELACAYAASCLDGEIRSEKLPQYAEEYLGRAFATYSLKNMRVGIKMACRAAGLENSPRLAELLSRVVFKAFQFKSKNYNRRRLQREVGFQEVSA